MTDLGRSGRRLTATTTDLEVVRQKAFLVGVLFPDGDEVRAEHSLDELGRLTDTAGSDPVDGEIVRRDKPHPATFIGPGKADELAAITTALDIDVVVFDHDLTPAQQRNLTKTFKCDVVDRQAVILDIFAQHATSREGMAQVELALLEYHLPRLRGKGTELSRLGGGIGTRGPGETKLETDRRRIQARIARLRRELKDLRGTRATQRKRRQRTGTHQVAVVGYTNAGKSTLLNRLTDAEVLVEDRLFSTVGSTTRRLELPDAPSVVLSDTVGFVTRLPHGLVEAFMSTLEEINEADLVLHIVDASDEDAELHMGAVHGVLEEIGAADVPRLVVINKADVASEAAVARLAGQHRGSVVVSALVGSGTDNLTAEIADRLFGPTREVRLDIPHARGDLIARAHRELSVAKQEADEATTSLMVRLRDSQLTPFSDYVSA